MDHGCCWTWTQSQSTLSCLGNSFRPRQRFGFHRVQVQHVAGLYVREMRTSGLTWTFCSRGSYEKNLVLKQPLLVKGKNCNSWISRDWSFTEVYQTVRKKTKNLSPTCSLFEEVCSCAGVCCSLDLLDFPNQIWNIKSTITLKLSPCNCYKKKTKTLGVFGYWTFIMVSSRFKRVYLIYI